MAVNNEFEGLWQDAEGTIPVTAVGQSVGKWGMPNGVTLLQSNPSMRPVLDGKGCALDADLCEKGGQHGADTRAD